MGFFDLDLVGDNTFFDKNWIKMLGYDPTKFEHSIDSVKKLIHPDDKEIILNKFNALLEGKIPFIESEERLLRNNGTWIWILLRAKVISWDETGKPIRILGTHMDINIRKIAEEKVREQERYLQNIIDNLPGYVTYVDWVP
ncbi:MAG: PAS domain-containing protein [Chloroflexia bacterium]|nr:PAS domain-containing protein [Chloroflexia bacterium]